MLNAAMQLRFRDSAISIGSPADGDLDINADDEIELNSTLIDINGNVEISGTAAITGVATFSATPVFPDGSIAVADLDIDGATDIGAAIVDADLFIIDDGAGGTNRKVTAARLKTYAGGGTDWEVISSTGSVSAGTYLEITGFNMVRLQAVASVTGTNHAHGINLSTSGSSNSGVSTQNGRWYRKSVGNANLATNPQNQTGAYTPSTSSLYYGSSDSANTNSNLEMNLYGLDETNVGIMLQEQSLTTNTLNRWAGQTASGSSTWFLYFAIAMDGCLVVGCK